MAGGTGVRPVLREALDYLRAGDTLVVWRLDRLGRSLNVLIARAEALRTQGVGLRSLKDAIDIDSSAGRFVFHIFGALVRERTKAGLAAARARGCLGGRRKCLDAGQLSSSTGRASTP